MFMSSHFRLHIGAAIGLAAWCAVGQTPAPQLDTKPAFMQIVTNCTLTTNVVIVTNYVVVTNSVVTTNFYNAQGHLLLPVPPDKPAIPGLIPITEAKPTESAPEKAPEAVPAPPPPDPLQVIRDLLVTGLTTSSNKVSATGSFSSNLTQQIQVPQGVTSFDRKKTQDLLTAMNVTAEKAAPEAVALLTKAAAQIKTEDAAATVKGGPGAATQLFANTHGAELESQLLALVQKAAVQTRLRDAYNDVMFKGGGLFGAVLGSGPSVDIESHVAKGLWRALTNNLAEQERLIRTDASARTTPALQEAFK